VERDIEGYPYAVGPVSEEVLDTIGGKDFVSIAEYGKVLPPDEGSEVLRGQLPIGHDGDVFQGENPFEKSKFTLSPIRKTLSSSARWNISTLTFRDFIGAAYTRPVIACPFLQRKAGQRRFPRSPRLHPSPKFSLRGYEEHHDVLERLAEDINRGELN